VGVTCLETDQRNMSAVSRGMFLDRFYCRDGKRWLENFYWGSHIVK